jgi:hypothetical protein
MEMAGVDHLSATRFNKDYMLPALTAAERAFTARLAAT